MRHLKPIEAYSFYVLNDLWDIEIIELANYWLENDVITDSFCQLCCVDNRNMNEIFKLFEAGMLELNITKPTLIEASLVIIRRVLIKLFHMKLML